MSTEEAIWSGTPSQVVNFGTFIVYGLFFWLVFPLFAMLWKWLGIKNTKYELTNQRFRTRYGILNKKMDDLELYRVKDYRVDNPLFLRMFSLGNIILQTSDKSSPVVTISAVPNAEELVEKIRTCVEARRDHKRVREVDFE
jgi:uncharacterized membrane protein YdbT with pleckstrin-like domain